MSKEFTEKWTEKTFENTDGIQLSVRHDKGDPKAMLIIIGDEEFWFKKEHGEDISRAIIAISQN